RRHRPSRPRRDYGRPYSRRVRARRHRLGLAAPLVHPDCALDEPAVIVPVAVVADVAPAGTDSDGMSTCTESPLRARPAPPPASLMMPAASTVTSPSLLTTICEPPLWMTTRSFSSSSTRAAPLFQRQVSPSFRSCGP